MLLSRTTILLEHAQQDVSSRLRKSLSHLVQATVVFLLVTGCASVTVPPRSGFLGHYSGLKADPKDSSHT